MLGNIEQFEDYKMLNHLNAELCLVIGTYRGILMGVTDSLTSNQIVLFEKAEENLAKIFHKEI